MLRYPRSMRFCVLLRGDSDLRVLNGLYAICRPTPFPSRFLGHPCCNTLVWTDARNAEYNPKVGGFLSMT